MTCAGPSSRRPVGVKLVVTQTPLEEALAEINARSENDMVEQVYAVLDSRNAPRCTLRRAWIVEWLRQGKSPIEIVNLALGHPQWPWQPSPEPPRKPDAHLGGRRA